MSKGTLVAGVGNIFMGDDAFGCEVVRRLAAHPVPDGVTVADFGIRGIHLAYELLEGYDRLILVDALPRGETPGTVYVMQPDEIPAATGPADAHSMDPLAVFGHLAAIGGDPVPTVIVGCEPATLDEEMGLSTTVEASVDRAVTIILGLLNDRAPVTATHTPARAG